MQSPSTITPPTNNTALISAHGVSIRFGSRKVLQNIDLQINQGQIVTLIGPNGAGKTTLVRAILGLIPIDAGTITKAANLSIGYMPQKLQIESTLPLAVARFLQLADKPNNLKSDSYLALLDELKVSHILDHQMHTISGGELQRVLLARALSRQPQLLILDEPAQGVDISGQVELYELIGKVRSTHNCGVLMISHDLHLVMSATDEVVCLNHHICCHGKPEQVSNDPAYLELFGKNAAANLAVYTHHHNHSHDIDGEVVEHHHD